MILDILNYLFAVTVPFTHIGGYVAAGLGFFLIGTFWKEVRGEKTVWWLLLFLAYGVLRNIFSAEPAHGAGVMFGYFGHWLMPFLLGYGISSRPARKTACILFAGTFILIIAFSILAYFGYFYSHIADVYLTEDGLLKGLRSHIALGAICIVLSFLAVSQAVFRTDIRRRTRALLALMTVFLFGALFLTGSRGYYIAAILSYGGFAVFYVIKTRQWKWFMAGAAGVAVLVAVLFFSSPFLQARIHHTGSKDNNIIERLSLYRVAAAEIRARPLTGFGPGQGVRQKIFFNVLPEQERAVQRHPHLHCFYLNFAADFGFIGAVFLILIIGQILKGLWQHYASGDDTVRSLAIGVFWGFVGVLIGECFDTLLRGPGTAMELFWLAGLVLGRGNREKGESR